MNASSPKVASVFKKSVAMLTMSACIFSWGCASLQDRYNKTVGPAPKVQTKNVANEAQSSATNLEAAAKQDISSNCAYVEDKFNTMLQQNGLGQAK